MSDRLASQGAFALAPRALLDPPGDGDALANLNTRVLADGASCFVLAPRALFRLNKESTAAANGVTVIAPIAGPGRWILESSGSSPTQGVVTPQMFGAVADGLTNDTVAVGDWLTFAYTNRLTAYAPSGTYLVDTVTWPSGFLFGIPIYGDGMHATIFKSRTGADIFDVQSTDFSHCVISDIGFDGNAVAAGAGSGFYIHVPGSVVGQLTFKNLWFANFGRSGIRCPDTIFSSELENVNVDLCYGHGLDLFGGSALTFINCYAHRIPTAATVGYRVASGSPTFIGCNGIDDGPGGWGFFGAEMASEGFVAYCKPIFECCNFEAIEPTTPGLLFRTGSYADFYGPNSFIVYAAQTNVVAIQYDFPSGGILGNGSTFNLGAGATWKNGFPIHITLGGGVPPTIQGTIYDESSTAITQVWNDATASAAPMPRIYQVTSQGLWYVRLNALAVDGPIYNSVRDNGTIISGSFIFFGFYTNKQQITLGAANTLISSGGIADGSTVVLYIVQDGMGGRTVSWSGDFHFGAIPNTVSAGAGAIDIFIFEVANSGQLYCVAANFGM